MSEYAKKTCNSCGIRLPQPDMYRVEKEVYTGSSNTGLTKRAVFGSLIGNERSQRQVGKYLFSPNKRKYKRKREVWMCGECAGVSNESFGYHLGQAVGTIILWAILIGVGYLYFFG